MSKDDMNVVTSGVLMLRERGIDPAKHGFGEFDTGSIEGGEFKNAMGEREFSGSAEQTTTLQAG